MSDTGEVHSRYVIGSEVRFHYTVEKSGDNCRYVVESTIHFRYEVES